MHKFYGHTCGKPKNLVVSSLSFGYEVTSIGRVMNSIKSQMFNRIAFNRKIRMILKKNYLPIKKRGAHYIDLS